MSPRTCGLAFDGGASYKTLSLIFFSSKKQQKIVKTMSARTESTYKLV
jgi:hypothetical protein